LVGILHEMMTQFTAALLHPLRNALGACGRRRRFYE
jgi:hypothetical protein